MINYLQAKGSSNGGKEDWLLELSFTSFVLCYTPYIIAISDFYNSSVCANTVPRLLRQAYCKRDWFSRFFCQPGE